MSRKHNFKMGSRTKQSSQKMKHKWLRNTYKTSTYLVIRGTANKTTLRSHHTPVWMAKTGILRLLCQHILEEETSTRKATNQTDYGKAYIIHFLDWWLVWIDDSMCAVLTLGAFLPEYCKKQAEQVTRIKPISSIPLCFSSCLQVSAQFELPWFPSVLDYDIELQTEINSSLGCFWSWYFMNSNRNTN